MADRTIGVAMELVPYVIVVVFVVGQMFSLFLIRKKFLMTDPTTPEGQKVHKRLPIITWAIVLSTIIMAAVLLIALKGNMALIPNTNLSTHE